MPSCPESHLLGGVSRYGETEGYCLLETRLGVGFCHKIFALHYASDCVVVRLTNLIFIAHCLGNPLI